MTSKKRRPLNDSTPLHDNPFARQLDGLHEGLPDPPPPENRDAPPTLKRADSVPFTIGKTRKGSYDIRVENRPKGKKATVLRRVEGDAAKLLKMLKTRLGTGGVCREDALELQGDHLDKLARLLDEENWPS